MTGLIPIPLPGAINPLAPASEPANFPPARDHGLAPTDDDSVAPPASPSEPPTADADTPPSEPPSQPLARSQPPPPPATAFIIPGRGINAGAGQYTVLIVDDELPFAKALSRILADRGYTVLIAGTAQDGIYLARFGHPDVILLDLLLPDMSGTEACRELVTNPQTRDIPIVVVSYKTGTADEVAALESGADDFLTKPYAIEVLIARIRKQIERRRPHSRMSVPV
jgi:CheY-like chemotaxis protein